MTTYGPFAETSPSGLTGWIDERRRPLADHLRLVLGKLDAATKFTYTAWRGPDTGSIVVRREDVADAFIQAAGSAEAMTVEVRLPGNDGRARLYTLGRAARTGDRTVLVPISPDRAVRVLPEEIFTADQAAEVFTEFLRTGTVASVYTRRELDLSDSQSERR